MLELLHTTEEEFKNKGATTTQMENVFKAFNITARLFDFNGKLIYSFDPPDYHKHTKGFFGLIKNNHVYTINRDLKSIKKTMNAKNKPSHCDANNNTTREDFKLKISSNYYISDREEPPECHMIETANDLLKYTEKPEYTLVHKDNDLVKLFHELKMAGYEPFIKYQAGTMTELKVNWKIKGTTQSLGANTRATKQEITYTIKLQNLSTHSIDEDVSVENEKLFNDMNREMFNFNKKIFNDAHKSYYSQTDIDILDECRTIVPTGYFKNNSTNETVEIDRTKAFTKAFSKITHIPVFTEFDIWKPYQNEELQGLNLYLVEASTGNIFFNKKFNLVYGMFLKRLEEKTFKIHYHKQPSHIHEVDYENIVSELWNTKISDKPKQDAKIKKTIANVNFGLLEKSTNKKQKSISFNSLEEALYYRNIYEGRVFVIEEGTLEDDEEGTLFTKYTDKYYILNVSKFRTLTNGFRYIKELLLQNHNYDMYDTYNTLTKNNIEIFSVKSDAFVINKNHLTKAKKLITFNNQVGGWRAETDKEINFPTEPYKYRLNIKHDIPIYTNNRLNIADEWNTEAICHQIIENNPCMVRAKYAGSGKSYICEHFQKLNYNVLFVVPNNRQIQEIKCEAVTLNRFFSIPVHKGDELPYYDHSEYNVIVFDEVYMANAYILNKIREFTIRYKNQKIIIGTGDTKQLPPINDLSNTQPYDTYADNCINIIFNNDIFLEICKRVGEKDRETMNSLYNDFWLNKLPIETIAHKYFQFTNSTLTSPNNIAYTNARCDAVAKDVRQKLGKTSKYEVGEILICRKYLQKEGMKFNVNIRYKILHHIDDKYVIQDIKEKTKYLVEEKILNNHFRYGYCATCHSCQRASIGDRITIHEWNNSKLVTRQ